MEFNDPQYLPDEWLIELGRIVQAWTNFEALLNLLLGKLSGFDTPFETVPSILITHSSVPQRLDMFAALCEARIPDHDYLRDYKRVLALVRQAQSQRNRFMHFQVSTYDCEPGKGRIGVTTARGKLKQLIEEVTLDELKQTSEDILRAGREMLFLVIKPKP